MRKIFILALYFIMSFFAGCSSIDKDTDKKVVIQINKYKMTVEDLKYELKRVRYEKLDFLKTEKGRKEYVDKLIEREILLQEAQRQGLDREKDFMKSIENYWEQALLKLLIQRKSREIAGLVYVYDNEIEEYYKNSGEQRPFREVKDDIKSALRKKKETQAMNSWIEDLRKKTYVKIDKDILKEVFSK